MRRVERNTVTTLHELLGVLPPTAALEPPSAAGVVVRDVTHDSRQIRPGAVFACRPGGHVDGHTFAAAALAAGAVALLVERRLEVDAPQVVVPSVASAIGPVAALLCGRPADQLLLLGVTGTNGKTTTAFLLESVLRAAGHRTGLIGTVVTRVADREVPGVRTTPEAADLQRLLRDMVDDGVTGAAMEVSSHGLALGRVDGVRFRAAAFTNLTQDHLDFHADLEDYFRAKASLFTPERTPIGVINVDDAHGRRLADEVRGIAVVRTSTAGAHDAEARALDVGLRPDGATFTADVRGRRVGLRTRLPGAFNVANALAAVTLADAVGIGLDVAAEGVAALAGVPGRMERVDAGQPFTVLVDYAHTPDSVQNVLRAARQLTAGRVLVVVGCGGDRDALKRPAMGRAAAALADRAVLTSDNPRSEDPLAILDAVAAGAATVGGASVAVEPDRRTAIAIALGEARAGDVVVLAGKGHEPYQEIAGRTIPFDDRLVAREILVGLAPGEHTGSGDAVAS